LEGNTQWRGSLRRGDSGVFFEAWPGIVDLSIEEYSLVIMEFLSQCDFVEVLLDLSNAIKSLVQLNLQLIDSMLKLPFPQNKRVEV